MAGKEDVTEKTPLKAKQNRFCLEYIKSGDGTKAAIRAGYSEKTAPQIASRLLKNVNVKARLAKLQTKLESKAIMSKTEVLEELSLLARVDMADFIQVQDDNVIHIKPFDALAPGASRCIRKLKQRTVRKVDPADPKGGPLEEITTEFELWSKTESLGRMGQHHDLFKSEDGEDSDKPTTVNVTFTDARKP